MGVDCGCDERKEKLNKLFPKKTPLCMNEKEFVYWGKFQEVKASKITNEESVEIARIWNRLFNEPTRPKYEPCKCSPKAWQKMIEEINHVYSTYNT